MITINATGDTTLHTAGKYCAEDILVKVPAGGSSGGASVETCNVTVRNISNSNGVCAYTMYANGMSYGSGDTILANSSKIFSNILRNTAFIVCNNSIMSPSATLVTNAKLECARYNAIVFTVGSESSEDCEITYTSTYAEGGFN